MVAHHNQIGLTEQECMVGATLKINNVIYHIIWEERGKSYYHLRKSEAPAPGFQRGASDTKKQGQ